MKLAERVMDVEGNLTGTSFAMKLDPEAAAKLISMLTELYADPELAIIREYSTNAFDAHVEAGVTEPIQVTTPTNLSPFLKVRDFGLGLNAEDIRDVYSMYGRSTKTDTDEQVGMLGLGCKSGLAYTNQFTLRGIKDGLCTEVIISRTEDGGGTMTVIDEYQTDERSGVEIVIPVKGFNQLAKKGAEFFRFWTHGSVLLNGEIPKVLEGTWLTDDLLITKELSKSYIVMGNVPYPMENDGVRGWNAPKIVAHVPIGAVEFPPSREALQMTQRTKDTVANVIQRVKDESTAAFERDIAAAASYPTAILKMHEVTRLGYDGKNPLYNNEPVPAVWQTGDKAQLMTMVNFKKPRYNKGWSHEARITTQYDVIWLVGYDGADFTPTKRKKLEQWWEGVTWMNNPDHFMLVDRIPRHFKKWIEPSKIMDWSEVAAQKLVRANARRGDGRPTGSYEGTVAGEWKTTLLAGDIDTTKPIFYYNSTHGTPTTQLEILKSEKLNATVVAMSSNRVAKFKRDFPMALEVRREVEAMAKRWFKRLTDTDKVMLKMRMNRISSGLSRLDSTRIDDPSLRKAVESATLKKDSVIKKWDMFGPWLDLSDVKIETGIEKYPLYDDYKTSLIEAREQMYIYFNAVYAAAQEDNNNAV